MSSVMVEYYRRIGIEEWPFPKMEKELRSFSLASYCRRFMEGFSRIASPQHSLVGGPKKQKCKKVKPKQEGLSSNCRPLTEKLDERDSAAFMEQDRLSLDTQISPDHSYWKQMPAYLD